MSRFSQRLEVRIEVPRSSLIKRHPDGRLDFLSPLPCPYNYGSVLGTSAPDGDPLDAVVLGPRLPFGMVRSTTARDVVGFLDGGVDDPKLICSDAPLSAAERRGVLRFFRRYALLKGVLNRARGVGGATRCQGWQGLESLLRAPSHIFEHR